MDEQIVPYEPEESALAVTIDDNTGVKVALIAAAVIIALLSFFLAGDHFSKPEAYNDTIASLDAKKADVTGLVAASTAVSAAITAIPGDAGTPIAEKLVDLSSDFLIVLTAIYLEKYLLTTLGFAAFKFLIPLACALVIAAIVLRGRATARGGLARLSAKLALFAVAIVLVVPASVFMSNMIENTYSESINATIEGAKSTADDASASAQTQAATSSSTAANAKTQTQEQQGGVQGFLQSLIGRLQELPEDLSKGVAGVTQDVQNTLNNFIEALAIMIVTSCVIPILVLVFFLWIVKLILGINVSTPMGMLRPRVLGKR